MLGTKLLVTLLSLIVAVTAQNRGWTFNRSFSRFPPRIIPRPAITIPNPTQSVPASLPAISNPAPVPPVQVTTEAKPIDRVPSTRSPLVPSYISPSQRTPVFWRPRPWSQPSSTFRPNRVIIYPSPAVTPKPQVSVVYPANYKPASQDPALVRESEIISSPSSSSKPQVIPGSQSENIAVSTTAVTIIYPESITSKPSNIGAVQQQWNARPNVPSKFSQYYWSSQSQAYQTQSESSSSGVPPSIPQNPEKPQALSPPLSEKPADQPSLEIAQVVEQPSAQPSQEIPQTETKAPASPQLGIPQVVSQPSTQAPLDILPSSSQPLPQPLPDVPQPSPQPEVSQHELQPQSEIAQPPSQPSAQPNSLPLSQGNPRFLGQKPWSKPIWSFVTKPTSYIPWISTTVKPLINRITGVTKPTVEPSPKPLPEVSQPSPPPVVQPEVSQPAIQPSPQPQPEILQPAVPPADQPQSDIQQPALQPSAQPESLQPNQENPRFLGQKSWSKPIWSFVTKPISYIPWISTTAKPLINRITGVTKPAVEPSPKPLPEVSQPSPPPVVQPEVSQPAIQPSPQPQPEILQPAVPPADQPQSDIQQPALQPSAQPESIQPNQENPRFLGQKPWSNPKPIWNYVTKPLANIPWIASTIKPLIPRNTGTPSPVYKPIISTPIQSPRIPANPGLTGLMDYQCAQPNGYFPVAHECDTFIECKQNIAVQVECPDGLHFNPNTVWPEYPCDYPSIVRCAANLESQPPQPTASCPRQNGYFPSISGDCGKYIICQEGKATEMTCPSGLAFNYEQSICDWPANVPSCNPNVFKGFTCPAPGVDENGKPSDSIFKYRFNKSCKSYIACQRGSPRLLSCDNGFSYDEVTQSCVNSDFVTDCI